MKAAQIGAAGALLVQYRLLKAGIDSAAMTTDDGIDLVTYSPRLHQALTIQVKTNLKAKPGGGKGALALDWWLRLDSPAQLVALGDLSSDSIWMFTHDEFVELAQQKSGGRAHLYFYEIATARTPERSSPVFFEKYRLERRIDELFGPPEGRAPSPVGPTTSPPKAPSA